MPLSDKQREIIQRRGKFVVMACPGSGKTHSVAYRLHSMACNWNKPHQGIASISFTNVAWQEIVRQLGKLTGIEDFIRYPHFIGTIDGFLNRYVLLPFGKLVLGCGCRPDLIGPPINDWEPSETINLGSSECHRRQCKLNQISFDTDGNIYNLRYPTCPRQYDKCIRVKKILFKKGYVTQTDANYISLLTLQQYPRLAKYIARRFPVVMIDEAQDTSDVQIAILDILIRSGLEELMLIGDPYQAIYEWRRARPDLFKARYEVWKSNSVVFDESFRSSQLICDFADKLSRPAHKTLSRNQEATALGLLPEIIGYKDDQRLSLVPCFLDKCRQNNILPEENDLVVLARGSSFIRELVGISTIQEIYPWNDKFTRDLCLSKCLFELGKPAAAYRRLEKSICNLLKGTDYCGRETIEEVRQEHGFSAWRKEIYSFLNSLPNIDCKLGDWVELAQSLVESYTLIPNVELKVKRNSSKCRHRELVVTDIARNTEQQEIQTDYRFGTVHSVKGESCDAVMLVLRTKGANGKKYVRMLDDDLIQNEEMRIVYVALTRARKAVYLAVPIEDKETWEARFITDS